MKPWLALFLAGAFASQATFNLLLDALGKEASLKVLADSRRHPWITVPLYMVVLIVCIIEAYRAQKFYKFIEAETNNGN